MAMTIHQVSLPETLPVFLLTGVLLLPGTVLPLHVFEPRYRAMVEDALSGDRVFGMIQPFTPQLDNRPLPGAENTKPDLYKVGCADASQLRLHRNAVRVSKFYDLTRHSNILLQWFFGCIDHHG